MMINRTELIEEATKMGLDIDSSSIDDLCTVVNLIKITLISYLGLLLCVATIVIIALDKGIPVVW
jgi:hypothetical protein